MRAALRLSTLLLSPLTLMCTVGDPGGDVGTAGSASQSGNATGGSVLPQGGEAQGGSNAGAGAGQQTAGTPATSGSGSGGAASSGGSAGTAGGTATPGPAPTLGCTAADPAEEPQKWLQRDITVENVTPEQQTMFGLRKYFVRLPVGYDHTKPYPVVFYGPGCGASNVEATPMMDQIKNDAIHVFLLQKSNCFSTGSSGGVVSPEVPYFTQALDQVQAKYCTDSKRVFVSGYSSGAWLSNMLACALGPRIRAIGTAAGGLTKATTDLFKCDTMGAPAAGVLYSGENDTENPADRLDANGNQIGVMGARDRLIKSNGCDPTKSTPYAANPICTEWRTGCENNPVLYCIGPGDGHGKGDGKFNVSNKAFWDVWSNLP
jgi:poly(3-hydroxybutyrate) depolymerase